MNQPVSRKKTGLHAGWILVIGLILLCLAGTGLTWWNYSRQVYSSALGVVLEPQWPESRIAVELPRHEAGQILTGHGARITVGKETKVLRGEVVSVTSKQGAAAEADATVIVKLLGEPGGTGRYLPTGARCSVTIDTTVPPHTISPSAK